MHFKEEIITVTKEYPIPRSVRNKLDRTLRKVVL